MTLKFDGWSWKTIRHLFYATYFKLFASFRSQLQSGNAKFGSNSMIFFSCVTLKFDWWPWNTIGHLFYPISSFVYHFIPTGEFKLDLQSGNAQFGSKSTIFFSRVTFKLDGWPSKTIAHLFYDTSSLCIISMPSVNSNLSWSPETLNLGQNRRFY